MPLQIALLRGWGPGLSGETNSSAIVRQEASPALVTRTRTGRRGRRVAESSPVKVIHGSVVYRLEVGGLSHGLSDSKISNAATYLRVSLCAIEELASGGLATEVCDRVSVIGPRGGRHW